MVNKLPTKEVVTAVEGKEVVKSGIGRIEVFVESGVVSGVDLYCDCGGGGV